MDADPAPPATPAAPARRPIDRRTIATIVALATVCAMAAALVAVRVLGDDTTTTDASTDRIELSDVGDVSPDRLLTVALRTPLDEPTNLDEHVGGTPAVVNFWQSSCAPCIEEMPLLQGAADANPQIVMVGVASQDRVDNATALAEQTAIGYPWFLDPEGNLFYEARAAGMPTTLLLDAQGRIVSTKTGAFKSAAELQAFIDQAGS
jgi:thiol-disulfide isomerase/thioredoxin